MDHKTGGTCSVFSVWPVPLPSFEKEELFVPLLRAASGSVAQVPTLGSHADQPSISAQQQKETRSRS